MYLLDVNVLIALVDTTHVHHKRVANWFLEKRKDGWSSCPITENGFIRIFGHSKYPDGPSDTGVARRLLQLLLAQPGHEFWADTISVCDSNRYPKLPPSKHLTDYYLLALALKHEGSLATLDQHIDPSLLPGGAAAYCLIPY